MLDTKGPEIRTGFLKDGKAVEIEKGQTLELSKLNFEEKWHLRIHIVSLNHNMEVVVILAEDIPCG